MVSNAVSEIETIDFESVNEKALTFVKQGEDQLNNDDRTLTFTSKRFW
jgi:hypothetical protein